MKIGSDWAIRLIKLWTGHASNMIQWITQRINWTVQIQLRIGWTGKIGRFKQFLLEFHFLKINMLVSFKIFNVKINLKNLLNLWIKVEPVEPVKPQNRKVFRITLRSKFKTIDIETDKGITSSCIWMGWCYCQCNNLLARANIFKNEEWKNSFNKMWTTFWTIFSKIFVLVKIRTKLTVLIR